MNERASNWHDQFYAAACALQGVDPEKVLKFRSAPEIDEVYLIMDYGIKGCPKYTLSFTEVARYAKNASELETNISATPQARKLAEAHGIDLRVFAGIGTGKVRVADVRALIDEGAE